VLKARRGGYDGRGVWIVESSSGAAETLKRAGGDGLLMEQWLPIERELAVLLARRPGGEAVVYPVVETVQVDGICHEAHAPARLDRALTAEAERLIRRVAEISGVVGMLAVDLFVVGVALVINEVAVRPHNSGHFSVEGRRPRSSRIICARCWTCPSQARPDRALRDDGERTRRAVGRGSERAAGRGAGGVGRPRPSLRQGGAAGSASLTRHGAGRSPGGDARAGTMDGGAAGGRGVTMAGTHGEGAEGSRAATVAVVMGSDSTCR
jgi:hypothetical protein